MKSKLKPCKANIAKEVLWDESVFRADIEGIDNSLIIDYYHKLKKENPEGKNNSNDGGYQVYLEPDNCEELDRLMITLSDLASAVWNRGFERKEQLVISNCWFNGNSFGDNNLVHTHPGATLSGVYYLTDGKPEHGEIHFCRSNHQVVHSFRSVEEERKAAYSEEQPAMSYNRAAQFCAKASRALLFAPWLEHGVTSNKTNDLRIVIGLNFTVAGKENENHLDIHNSDY